MTTVLLGSASRRLRAFGPLPSQPDCPAHRPVAHSAVHKHRSGDAQSHTPSRAGDDAVQRGEVTTFQLAISVPSQFLRVPRGHGREASLLSLGSREGFQEEVIFERCLES